MWILICNVYWHFAIFIALYIARYSRISHNLVDNDTCTCMHCLVLEPDWQTSGSAVEKLRMGLLDCMWYSHPIPIFILSAFSHSKSFKFIGCLGCFHLQVALNLPKHTFFYYYCTYVFFFPTYALVSLIASNNIC